MTNGLLVGLPILDVFVATVCNTLTKRGKLEIEGFIQDGMAGQYFPQPGAGGVAENNADALKRRLLG